MPSTLLERNEGILARLRNLRVLEPKLRAIYTQGKRAHLLAGQTAQGLRFAPLRPSTLAHRRGTGPPLSPQFDASQIVVSYRVNFEHRENSIVVSAGWPMSWVRYHATGTRRMSRRDPGGFREQDVRAGRELFRQYVMTGGT